MDWIKNNAGLFTLGIFLVAIMAYMENRLGGLETELRTEIRDVRTELRTEIQAVKTELKAEIRTVNQKLDQLIIALMGKGKTAALSPPPLNPPKKPGQQANTP